MERTLTKSTLLKRFGYTSIETLVQAVIRVFEAWEDEKPGSNSDQWYMSLRYYRPRMVEAVTEQWCHLSGQPAHLFPFHEDFVAYVWMAYRKEGSDKKDELKQVLCGLFVQ